MSPSRGDVHARSLGGVVLLPLALGCAAVAAAPRPTTPDPVRCIGVLPYVRGGASEQTLDLAGRLTADKLMEAGALAVLEPAEADRILGALGLRQRWALGLDGPVEVGQFLGLHAVLVGEVLTHASGSAAAAADESVDTIRLRLLAVPSGEELLSASASAAGPAVLVSGSTSRAARVQHLIADALDPHLASLAGEGEPAKPCWRMIDVDEDPALSGRIAEEPAALVVTTRGGETLSSLAARHLLSPNAAELVAAANPAVDPHRRLSWNTEIKIPRYAKHVVKAGETLRAVAEAELGQPGLAVLIEEANRKALGLEGRGSSARLGLLVDATQRWGLFDALGNVDDMYVVVNGVAASFPRVRVALNWLMQGRMLVAVGGKPADAIHFAPQVELADKVRRWLLEIRGTAGSVEKTISGDGAVPAKISWDGLLAEGRPLADATVYSYQLTAFYAGSTVVKSPVEVFGVNTTALPPRRESNAAVGGEQVTVKDGRFRRRYNAGESAGIFSVQMTGHDGSFAATDFFLPTVSIIRPRAKEMLEAGVDNEIYSFPGAGSTAERLDAKAVDRISIKFNLLGRTEPGNHVLVDGVAVPLDAEGVFRHTLQLEPGLNIFSVLARSQQGSQTLLEESVLLRTRGPDDSPWEYESALERVWGSVDEPLPAGVELQIPLLRGPGRLEEAAEPVPGGKPR